MLDDLDFIARFDSQNALAVTAGFADQLVYSELKIPKLELSGLENIVLSGMGGSALAGLLVRDWLEDKLPLPFVINRDYTLPAFVGKKTLVIASSYSGNTEEALVAAKAAQAKKAQVLAIDSGGKLSKQSGVGSINLPGGLQPRMAVGFGIRALTELLEQLGLVSGALAELTEASASANTQLPKLVMQTKTAENPAKQLAEQLMGKAIWVYGSPSLSATAYKWKINFNENAKNLSSSNTFPEFAHNEILGWTGQPVDKPFAVVELQSRLDGPRIAKRFEVSNKLLSGKMPKPIEIQAEGKTKIEQIVRTLQLGDFASIYLAILNQVNPTKIEIIDKLKRELNS